MAIRALALLLLGIIHLATAAVGRLPYRAVITGRSVDVLGGRVLTVSIVDADGVIKVAGRNISIGSLTYSPGEIQRYLDEAIAFQGIADAGSVDAWFTVLATAPSLQSSIPQPPTAYDFIVGRQVWTAMPVAGTELLGQTIRRPIVLGNFREARIVVRVATAGFAGSQVAFQWSTDETTWTTIAATVTSIAATGLIRGAWFAVPTGQQEVILRAVGSGGNGVISPVIDLLTVEAR